MKDVEENPGPLTEEQLKAILDGQKALNSSMNSIKERLEQHITQTNERLSSIERKVEKIETQVKATSDSVPKLEACERVVHHLSNQVLTLGDRITGLENYNRQNNLIVYGLDEDTSETNDLLKEKVIVDIFENKLGVKVSSTEKIHRLGKQHETKIRPVMIRFSSRNEKAEVMRNAYKLKGSVLSLSEDYTFEVREKRRHLWAYAKAQKSDPSNKVRLTYDKLIINGQMFTWNAEIEKVVAVKRA